jgi:hypothetical protein
MIAKIRLEQAIVNTEKNEVGAGLSNTLLRQLSDFYVKFYSHLKCEMVMTVLKEILFEVRTYESLHQARRSGVNDDPPGPLRTGDIPKTEVLDGP